MTMARRVIILEERSNPILPYLAVCLSGFPCATSPASPCPACLLGQVPAFNCGGAERSTPVVVNFR